MSSNIQVASRGRIHRIYTVDSDDEDFDDDANFIHWISVEDEKNYDHIKSLFNSLTIKQILELFDHCITKNPECYMRSVLDIKRRSELWENYRRFPIDFLDEMIEWLKLHNLW